MNFPPKSLEGRMGYDAGRLAADTWHNHSRAAIVREVVRHRPAYAPVI